MQHNYAIHRQFCDEIYAAIRVLSKEGNRLREKIIQLGGDPPLPPTADFSSLVNGNIPYTSLAALSQYNAELLQLYRSLRES